MNKNNLTFLGEAVEADEVLFPWNRQKIQSQQVWITLFKEDDILSPNASLSYCPQQ